MKKIFYGWWIVLATSLIHFWAAGTFFYSFTAFFNPIVNEFGWSYAATSFAASLRSIEGGIAAPLVGFAADRYGPRRLILIGSVLCGLGFFLLSRIQSLMSYYLLFVFLSVGSSLMFPVPGWTAIANWFYRRRGAALGILSTSIGIGGVLISGVTWLIDTCGWRQTLVIIAVGMWGIGIPCSLLVRHRPEPYGFFPDGENRSAPVRTEPDSAPPPEAQDAQEFSVREAMKTRVFWFLALVMTLSAGSVHALTVHVMPCLISAGFDRAAAGIVASLLVLASTVGRFGMGWLAGFITGRHLMAICLLLQVLGLVVLSAVQNFWQAVIALLLFGPGYGGLITLRLTLQAEYFGRKTFGSLQGITMGIAIIGTMSFPFLAGLFYDLQGSYRATWLVMAALLVLVVPLALKAHRPTRG